MLIKRITITFLACIVTYAAIGQAVPKTANGTIKRHAMFSSKNVDARNIDVWLPASYDGKKKFPVLYMHDGQMLFDSTTTWNKQEWGVDETLHALAQLGFKEIIVVGVWNSGPNRHIDYFPQKAFELLSEKTRDSLYKAERNKGNPVFHGNVQSDKYLHFLVKELKPFIDSTYKTLSDVPNTFIAGASMGGLISMYAYCEYPNVFGGAACLSTHWPGIFQMENNPIPNAFINYLEKFLPKPSNRKIYFDYGNATLDALYPPLQQQVDQLLSKKGYTGKQWLTLAFPGEDHSEKAWNKRLHIPIQFLLQ
jgi:predicted alpha/beta superfamily hydrolase